MKKLFKKLFILLAIIIGLYPIIYFLIDRKFGLLQTKSDELLSNFCWNVAFYSHIIPGGIALLVGWIQFIPKLRSKKIKLHRNIGKLYVASVLISSLSGIYIGVFATGGIWSAIGFISLALIWFTSTLLAYLTIKKGKINEHHKMMIYSYAACSAAITLRIWLPLLVLTLKDFTIAYRITAWVCWIPNIIFGYFLIKKLNRNI
ncbi:DUF2306 domain-containing protein [Flavobacterium defluvii]|uniref:Uncharacterized membrane protein n=1 Tax=Flavobacterium defluvii TaxID=370979 RepID=A0A1M5KUT7_9FLAO|nr:DUF2306 domain-containing protein [Flavobacterium defluvii]SHG56612.1 Uncharacterized membrane protein [Flavobacterium defluvii]